MTNCRELFSAILLSGILFLAATSANLTDQEDVRSFAPSPEPEHDAPLSPWYLPFSLATESPSPDSPETEPDSPSPVYPPSLPPFPELKTGSPPAPSFESSPPEFPPILSPAPEVEPPADSDSSIPSMPLSLPSMAPISRDDKDAEPPYEPMPSTPPSAYDQPDGISNEEPSENYSEGDDGSADSSSSDRQSKGSNGAMLGFVAGVCLVGLGGFVYLKRREKNGMRRSKYDQYLELGRRESL